ncbi:HD domain-containing protein [Nitratidesulfovibrio sp. 1201_IL3209]|jgi:putative hydrolase of HD superfamily|uniref:HD domain-containing protein n=1 Tax=Nitratidesulfovibrio sp. 1201_IL3209 TaxID=3084053 RepID=UPI002FD97153
MPSIRKSLLQFVFSGAYMKRWNDKLRPVELMEVDKQAHKMIVAWLLLQLNTRNLPAEERLRLGAEVVEGGLFDYFYRLVITDVKPPVFYRIKENEAHYRELTEWVADELEHIVRPLDEDFWQRLLTYIRRREKDTLADRILTAAHLYASGWEFNLIKPLNGFDDEMPEIDGSFQRRLTAMADLAGVPELIGGSSNALGRFANLCGQLRFQKRWSQTPRIPETSVIGHMFIVACYAYFFSIAVGACPARRLNNFFCGLFHDLPEVLTRDIISPVKRSVKQLPELIRQYEEQEMQERVFSLLDKAGYGDVASRLGYFLGLATGSEFDETVREPGPGGVPDGTTSVVRKVTFDELQNTCNIDELDPKDGRLVKACDTLAAFIEAHTSVRNGVTSSHLQEAIARLRGEYRRVTLGPLHVGALFADFD